jgi:hypothetical protein
VPRMKGSESESSAATYPSCGASQGNDKRRCWPTDRVLTSPAPRTCVPEENDYEMRNYCPFGLVSGYHIRSVCTGWSREWSSEGDHHPADADTNADFVCAHAEVVAADAGISADHQISGTAAPPLRNKHWGRDCGLPWSRAPRRVRADSGQPRTSRRVRYRVGRYSISVRWS